jgi:Na+/H+ antiporter NhaC
MRLLVAGLLLFATLGVALIPALRSWQPAWPALVSLMAMVFFRNALYGLSAGVLAGGLILAGAEPLGAVREVLASHLFPSLQGPWRLSALGFTLILGAFAGLLEHSGGFETLFRRVLGHGLASERRLLWGVYATGLVCFFDGLASSMLAGRLARPWVDRAGIPREKLAWIVDSTSSPVACVALVSTWVATQLSLIQQGLEQAPFHVAPYSLYLASILANPYCVLTLVLLPVAIGLGYTPQVMRHCPPRTPEGSAGDPPDSVSPRVVLWPLVVLAPAIVLGFPLLASAPVNLLSPAAWQAAFSGDSGPYALLVGSAVGLAVAWSHYPEQRPVSPAEAAWQGAGGMLPARAVLVLAWTLGSVLEALGAGAAIGGLFTTGIGPAWIPLLVFVLGCGLAFVTGSSWGTMALLTPLALAASVQAGVGAGFPTDALWSLCAAVIGAVFGGATFGDHCSPFSDTTIVSALSSGCAPTAHVWTQLPAALWVALASVLAYAGMALGLSAGLATGLMALMLLGGLWLARDKELASSPLSEPVNQTV